jgi:predicted RND superfamily exporter protein
MAAILCQVAGRGVATVEALRAAAHLEEKDGFDAFVAGNAVERVEFAETIRRDQAVFVPLIAVTLALLTAFLFRQLWGVVLPLAIVGASVATTLGAAAALGRELNAVSSMLTPVVMVVSIAVSVNFLVAYAQARAGATPDRKRIDSVAEALGRVGLPCLLTTATCAAGFGSLGLSDVPAIADFGSLCALGVSLSYVWALLFLPPLLALEWRAGPGSLELRRGKIETVLAHAAPFLERRRGLVLAGAAVAVLVAIAGIARIRVETDILGQLPSQGELLRATRAIDESLSGVNTIEVLLEGPPGAFRKIEAQRGLAALAAWLDRQPGVAKTFSSADLLMRVNDVKRHKRELPPDQDALDYAFGLLDRGAAASKDADPLRAFLSADSGTARLSAHLRSMPSSQNIAIIRGLAAEAPKLLPAGVRAQPTGDFVLLQDMTAELPYAMLRGLVVATVLIIGAMGAVFRSVRLAAIAAIPASIPIVVVYGLMGWTGIWLSVPTAMISSVVLGLAVDSTILFLSRYRDERAEGRPRREAVVAMLENAGQSVTYSNLTLIFGFAVGAASSFPPIRDFGVLTSLTVAASYLGALLLLPALIFSARPGSLRRAS